MNIKNIAILAFSFVTCFSCQKNDGTTISGLKKSDFQTEINGQPIDLFVLKNNNGMEACITNYGGRLVSLMVPDRNGKMEDIVCGFSTINDYMANRHTFGSTIGRYIGRILNATFTIDSITYQIQTNTGKHCGHGGNPGFAVKVWDAEQLDKQTLKLSLLSPDGDNGFPGNLQTDLYYRLTDNNELDIEYMATTDKPTVLNLSHHSFFNLSGDMNTTVEDQLLYINADKITPYDSLKCVTGEIIDIISTPFDFTVPRLIGERIDEENDQLKVTRGYDHNWVLNNAGDLNQLAAKVTDLKSGRTMEVYTNEPGIQVYTSNGLKGALVGKDSIAYQARTSICLETQHFPDSPNQLHFPSTLLRPGETYNSRCIYRFNIIP